MRRISMSLGLCALLAAGCADEAPEAGRAEPESPATSASSPVVSLPEQPPEAGQQPTAENSSASSSADGTSLQLEQVAFIVPAEWKSKPVSSSFIIAEYELPAAEGHDAVGRLTVSTALGSVDDNLQRWRDQFGGKPENPAEEKNEVNGLDVTLVDYSGEFKDQRGPFAPATQRPGYRMLGAIIDVGGNLHFVKAVGPQATIAAHADGFHAFIGSVRKK